MLKHGEFQGGNKREKKEKNQMPTGYREFEHVAHRARSAPNDCDCVLRDPVLGCATPPAPVTPATKRDPGRAGKASRAV